MSATRPTPFACFLTLFFLSLVRPLEAAPVETGLRPSAPCPLDPTASCDNPKACQPSPDTPFCTAEPATRSS
jgi:hypothetical protein